MYKIKHHIIGGLMALCLPFAAYAQADSETQTIEDPMAQEEMTPTMQWKNYWVLGAGSASPSGGDDARLDTSDVGSFAIESAGYDSASLLSFRFGTHSETYAQTPLRYEAEWTMVSHPVTFSGDTASGTADADVSLLMGNVYYDIKVSETFKPYIGLGFGLASVSYSALNASFSNDIKPITITGDDTDANGELTTQFLVGALFDVNPKLSIAFEYKSLPETDQEITADTSDGENVAFHTSYGATMTTLQLVFRF